MALVRSRWSVPAAVSGVLGLSLICVLGAGISFQTGENLWIVPHRADLIVTQGRFVTDRTKGREPPSFQPINGDKFYINCIPTRASSDCYDDSVIYSNENVILHYYKVRFYHEPDEDIFSSVIAERGVLGNDDATIEFLKHQMVKQNQEADKNIARNKIWFKCLIFPILACMGNYIVLVRLHRRDIAKLGRPSTDQMS